MTATRTPLNLKPLERPSFYRPFNKDYKVRIKKYDQRDGRIERAIRLYCTQFRESWSLQVRGPLGVGNFGLRDGKDDLIADASLNRDDMVALRDAINAALGDA